MKKSVKLLVLNTIFVLLALCFVFTGNVKVNAKESEAINNATKSEILSLAKKGDSTNSYYNGKRISLYDVINGKDDYYHYPENFNYQEVKYRGRMFDTLKADSFGSEVELVYRYKNTPFITHAEYAIDVLDEHPITAFIDTNLYYSLDAPSYKTVYGTEFGYFIYAEPAKMDKVPHTCNDDTFNWNFSIDILHGVNSYWNIYVVVFDYVKEISSTNNDTTMTYSFTPRILKTFNLLKCDGSNGEVYTMGDTNYYFRSNKMVHFVTGNENTNTKKFYLYDNTMTAKCSNISFANSSIKSTFYKNNYRIIEDIYANDCGKLSSAMGNYVPNSGRVDLSDFRRTIANDATEHIIEKAVEDTKLGKVITILKFTKSTGELITNVQTDTSDSSVDANKVSNTVLASFPEEKYETAVHKIKCSSGDMFYDELTLKNMIENKRPLFKLQLNYGKKHVQVEPSSFNFDVEVNLSFCYQEGTNVSLLGNPSWDTDRKTYHEFKLSTILFNENGKYIMADMPYTNTNVVDILNENLEFTPEKGSIIIAQFDLLESGKFTAISTYTLSMEYEMKIYGSDGKLYAVLDGLDSKILTLPKDRYTVIFENKKKNKTKPTGIHVYLLLIKSGCR